MDFFISLENLLGSRRGEFDSFEIKVRGACRNSEYNAERVKCKSAERKGYDGMSCRENFRIATTCVSSSARKRRLPVEFLFTKMFTNPSRLLWILLSQRCGIKRS